jgi:hypothetical protein
MSYTFKKDDIICTDKYLSLESPTISYHKTDLLVGNSNSIIWRNNVHTIHPSNIWITGHSDYSVDDYIFNKFNSNCRRWFTVNKDANNEKIKALPLGITNNTNESNIHPIYGSVDIMFDVLSQPKCFTNLVYLNFNINTYPVERQACYDYFYDKKYVTLGTINNTLEGRKRFLEEIRNHKFVLCPRGNGIDTHRLWETLYMGSIPIVKKHIAMSEFNDLPILFVDNWSDIIDEAFLENKYNEIINQQWNLDKLKFSYWKQLIRDTEVDIM